MNLILTPDQELALSAFQTFLTDPVETVFVLSGYSGCGKTTLVRSILDKMPTFNRVAKLINPEHNEYVIQLTATTNKAAENLAYLTGQETKTIHSFLGLRVNNDYKTNTTTLSPKNGTIQTNCLIFIDEASYIDSQLLGFIFSKTQDCKIVFVGDPAQLTPVKSVGAPVFESNFTSASLTQVVRQAEGNPIIDLSTKFRHTVNNGKFFQFKPDGHHIQYLEREIFNDKIIKEFSRFDWHYNDSKVLAWTNKCVINYNNNIREHITGDPEFQVGDYAIVNTFIGGNNVTFKTDQLVEITDIQHTVTRHQVLGNIFTLDKYTDLFMPATLTSKNARIKLARANNHISIVADIENTWVDLRYAYACTVNKAQGSTFNEIFIDLDDIRRCNSGDQIARMMYVAVSRAKNHVYMTGDLYASN